jgi:hypothetical protein
LLARAAARDAFGVDDALVSRREIAALLFNVSDVARSLLAIEKLLGGDDEEADEG